MPKITKIEHEGRRQAVIFDFDGTIADSFEYVVKFLKEEAGGAERQNVIKSESLRKMSMRDLALHLSIPVWRMPLIYFRGRRVMRAHMEHVQPFDGMIDVIRQLHQDGYTLLIASANSGHNIRHMLRGQGVLSLIRTIRSSAGITGKPTLIRQLLVRYRLQRGDVWYVGDEVGDMLAAKRAGVHSLAVSWGFADPKKLEETLPDGFATHPAEIVRIIESSWKK